MWGCALDWGLLPSTSIELWSSDNSENEESEPWGSIECLEPAGEWSLQGELRNCKRVRTAQDPCAL